MRDFARVVSRIFAFMFVNNGDDIICRRTVAMKDVYKNKKISVESLKVIVERWRY